MCKSPKTEVSWGLHIIRAALPFGVTNKSVLPGLARFVTPGGYVSYVFVFQISVDALKSPEQPFVYIFKYKYLLKLCYACA